jgi:hypothetical protein
MIDATKYLIEKGFNPKEKTRLFLKMSRIKYIINSDSKFKVCRTPGRYGGTKMSIELFELMKSWLSGEPLPQLNRKEFEVADFINSFFNKAQISQFNVGAFKVDWFIPHLNLVIEFFEKEHSYKKKYDTERINFISKKHDVFVIYEKTVMHDLALLSKKYRPL